MQEIAIVEVKSQKVLGMRKTGSYVEIATLLPQLFHYAFDNGIQIAGPPMFLCHEITIEEVKEADRNNCADVEVALPISGEAEETGEIKVYELPGGTMVKTIHKGPYEECEPTYLYLYAWLEKNGKTVTGLIREVYLNDPKEVKPEDILTETYAPFE